MYYTTYSSLLLLQAGLVKTLGYIQWYTCQTSSNPWGPRLQWITFHHLGQFHDDFLQDGTKSAGLQMAVLMARMTEDRSYMSPQP